MAGTATAPGKGRKPAAGKATAPAESAAAAPAAAKPVSRRERLGKTRATLSDDEDDNGGTETHVARARPPPAPPRRGRVVSDDEQDDGEDAAAPSRTAKRPREADAHALDRHPPRPVTAAAAAITSASNSKPGGSATSSGVAIAAAGASKGAAAARSGRARSTAELLDLLMESDPELSLEAAPAAEAPPAPAAPANEPVLAEKGPTRVSAIAAAAALGAIMGTPLDVRPTATTSAPAADVDVRPWEPPAPFEVKPPSRPVSAREMMSRLLGAGDDAL